MPSGGMAPGRACAGPAGIPFAGGWLFQSGAGDPFAPCADWMPRSQSGIPWSPVPPAKTCEVRGLGRLHRGQAGIPGWSGCPQRAQVVTNCLTFEPKLPRFQQHWRYPGKEEKRAGPAARARPSLNKAQCIIVQHRWQPRIAQKPKRAVEPALGRLFLPARVPRCWIAPLLYW
jgi:hypothetical protein